MERPLIEWCNINSGTLNRDKLEKMFKALEDAFSSLPGTHEVISLPNVKSYNEEEEPNFYTLGKALRISTRPNAPIQLLLSRHMDTGYRTNHPFQVCERLSHNKLKDPGVTDIKRGLLVMLKALEVFKGTEFTGNLGWQLLISPDE